MSESDIEKRLRAHAEGVMPNYPNDVCSEAANMIRHLDGQIHTLVLQNNIMRDRLSGIAEWSTSHDDAKSRARSAITAANESPMRDRLEYIEAEIEATEQWGGKLTALDEDRRSIRRSLGLDGLPPAPDTWRRL